MSANISHAVGVFHTRSVFHKCRQGFISLKKALRKKCCFLARPEGFEPPTFWSVAKRSIQLSQGRSRFRAVFSIT